MITQSLNSVIAEVSGLWYWIMGIVAGWGLTFTLVVAALIYAHIRINRLQRRIDMLNNIRVAENRDLSLRINELEK